MLILTCLLIFAPRFSPIAPVKSGPLVDFAPAAHETMRGAENIGTGMPPEGFKGDTNNKMVRLKKNDAMVPKSNQNTQQKKLGIKHVDPVRRILLLYIRYKIVIQWTLLSQWIIILIVNVDIIIDQHKIGHFRYPYCICGIVQSFRTNGSCFT